ncbi:YbhB/YbcL family Raf kinase inhibitor-like protein [Rhizobium sp. SSA_523]|uniref:YbhB/YbcL family Raf kinase inhibitor-like protein n=1 Tax=Rhizobium sp. SSA_523 TaxID=2952477 RepID=UPI0020906389|nr:YbhB/YbcL family Raf kinase inhibitor-like protein [Rhizobium sp. SSA_523]MCO5734202.1 YbhB/YbcL family Raf kinase inhibitor-like protein [Rhizobium sp. SSA_523]WKC21517.1 YbhB/YbcL family Raf kinase inhibitor-like protein [Rhizobium sp. SSA_523]
MPIRLACLSFLVPAALLPAAGLLASSSLAQAQPQPQEKVGEYSDVVIEGSILEPRKIEIRDDRELADLIKAPAGFKVDVFARDLVNPRMLAVSDRGTLYATRRSVGDVIMLKDEDKDGKAESVQTVASRPGMHGIAFDGNTVFLVTVNDVYKAEVKEDGTFGELTRIINDLPDSGQHPNRTLAIGPDDKLYISVGSTCNACDESNPENATMLRAEKDGSSRSIFASGLRNTIGFDWEPSTGALYGFDHGIDWLGDEEQVEEVNRIEQGKKYGWPYVYGMGEFNPQDNPPEGMTLDQWAKQSTEPQIGYTAHSAPMQMAFYDGQAFPEEYRGDAFVAMRGSWNRRPPSGYEVLRIKFENGEPVGAEHFLQGFLIRQQDGSYGYLARLAGIAVGKDGALYVADDSNGVIYRVSHDAKEGAAAASPAPGNQTAAKPDAATPNVVEEMIDSKIAMELVDPRDSRSLTVRSGFAADAAIPLPHAADGDNASPKLDWSGAPEGTKSFVVIVDDPDSKSPKPFVHWIAYDIPANVTSLREGLPTEPILVAPKGLKQGANSQGSTGYTGPKPPVGDPAHHYHFQVFALDVETLGLEPGAKRDAVLAAMNGHVLAEGELVGTFERPKQDP